MIYTVFLLCFISFCFGNLVNQTGRDDKLIFAQIIFRHGDRSIRLSYPNDPYKGEEHWPEGYGQLTNEGKQQQYELGQFFGRRYEKLLGDGTYSSDKIFTQSSQYERTINSAALVLAGLFPPKNNQIWNNDLLWQPIPVYAIPPKIDRLITHEKISTCARYQKLLNEYEKSPEIRAIYDENQELFAYLEKHTGMPIRTIEDVKDLHGVLDVEYLKNKTLPEWTHDVFSGGKMDYLSKYWLKLITGTTQLKRLKSGFILKDIFDRFKNKTLSTLSPDRSMWLYSGHDVTIASVLNSLGVFELHIPKYASSLLFELYELRNDHYVQIFYKNPTSENPDPVEIPNCGIKCPLNRLFDLYSEILTSDPDTECRLSSE